MSKPWTLRPMTPEEERRDPTAFAITDRETREITYVPGTPVEGMALGFRHEIGHVKFEGDWFYPETKGMSEDSTEWLTFQEDHPLWGERENFFSELLASYYSLSIDPRDPSAKWTIRMESTKAVEAGLSRGEVEFIKSKAREVVRSKVGSR